MSVNNNTLKNNNKTLYYSLVCGLPSLVIVGLSTYVYLNKNRIFSHSNTKCCKCCKCGDDCKCNPCKCCKCGDDCKCEDDCDNCDNC